MAEIEIEKKTPKWPWIILLLIAIAVLIYIFAFNDDEADDNQEQNTEESTATGQSSPNNSTVIAYVSFIKEDADDMGLDHEFTNEAFSKLTTATQAMADEISYDLKKDIGKVRTLLEKITQDPLETTHANSIKDAAGILAQSLQHIQEQAFPGLTSETNEVKKAAADIETDVHTLDQKDAIKGFFRQSADLLEKMNTNSPQN